MVKPTTAITHTQRELELQLLTDTLGKSTVGSETVSVPFCLEILNTCSALATDMNVRMALREREREREREGGSEERERERRGRQ